MGTLGSTQSPYARHGLKDKRRADANTRIGSLRAVRGVCASQESPMTACNYRSPLYK